MPWTARSLSLKLWVPNELNKKILRLTGPQHLESAQEKAEATNSMMDLVLRQTNETRTLNMAHIGQLEVAFDFASNIVQTFAGVHKNMTDLMETVDSMTDQVQNFTAVASEVARTLGKTTALLAEQSGYINRLKNDSFLSMLSFSAALFACKVFPSVIACPVAMLITIIYVINQLSSISASSAPVLDAAIAGVFNVFLGNINVMACAVVVGFMLLFCVLWYLIAKVGVQGARRVDEQHDFHSKDHATNDKLPLFEHKGDA